MKVFIIATTLAYYLAYSKYAFSEREYRKLYMSYQLWLFDFTRTRIKEYIEKCKMLAVFLNVLFRILQLYTIISYCAVYRGSPYFLMLSSLEILVVCFRAFKCNTSGVYTLSVNNYKYYFSKIKNMFCYLVTIPYCLYVIVLVCRP